MQAIFVLQTAAFVKQKKSSKKRLTGGCICHTKAGNETSTPNRHPGLEKLEAASGSRGGRQNAE